MIDVTIDNFETEVIAASMSVPVLVDFWAPWCAPCNALGPVLEKLEVAYAGRFTLVKINADEEQQLTTEFGVRSLPTCILLINGQPVDGFQGAQPESQVRAFLDKHVAAPDALDAPDAPDTAKPQDDLRSPLEKFQHAVAIDPANDDARFDYVKHLLELGMEDAAKVAFAPVIAKAATTRRLGALQCWMHALDFVAASADSASDIAELDAKITTNKRDFDARYARARHLMAAQRWTDAMDELLDILMRDKAWSDGLARTTYIAILELIEPPKVKVADGHIPIDDPVVSRYRRRLSSIVLS